MFEIRLAGMLKGLLDLSKGVNSLILRESQGRVTDGRRRDEDSQGERERERKMLGERAGQSGNGGVNDDQVLIRLHVCRRQSSIHVLFALHYRRNIVLSGDSC